MSAPVNPTIDAQKETRIGVIYGLGCYLAWGVIPIYFKSVATAAPQEVLAHRVVWSVVFLSLVLKLRRTWPLVFMALRSRRTMIALTASAILIAGNWYTYIWAMLHDQVVMASLGYYINPLVTVLLGFVLLRERLRPRQWGAVALAAAAVAYFTINLGKAPYISLILAVTFALYGLIRKVAPVAALPGLAIETAILAPIALGFLIWSANQGQLKFANHSTRLDVLLIAGGVVTAVPLWWFANAARRLPLSTVGILQYIAPTLQLLLGAVRYKEPTTPAHWITFAMIWTALGIYTADALLYRRAVLRKAAA